MIVTLWKNDDNYKRAVKLDFRCDCSTECAIYMYMCNICVDNDSFYVGQTTNSCQKRATGHRGCFTTEKFHKSALSYHIYKHHPQYISKKLSNYSMGVIKSVSAPNLDRAEDYHVELFNAALSLNRYKVVSWYIFVFIQSFMSYTVFIQSPVFNYLLSCPLFPHC